MVCEVARIVDDTCSAGQHTVTGDASSYPSGVTFYRINNVELTDTH